VLLASAALQGALVAPMLTKISHLNLHLGCQRNSNYVAGSLLMQAMDEFDKSKKMVVLIIDEAQVLATAEHSVFAHALRAALDIRKERLTVLFAGSSETTLRRMFGRVSEPFYNWAALEFTKAKVFNDGEFENQWQHLLPTDQLLLTLIAHDATDLQGREVRNTVGASLGLEKPVTAGAIQNSLRRLADKSVITRIDRGTYRVEDEAFADWVRHQD